MALLVTITRVDDGHRVEQNALVVPASDADPDQSLPVQIVIPDKGANGDALIDLKKYLLISKQTVWALPFLGTPATMTAGVDDIWDQVF